MHDESISTDSNTCALSDYGINSEVVDALYKSIVNWLEGNNLPWKQTNYVEVFIGPHGRKVAQLLFFHYDGPPEREIGSGGENNVCRMYLYDDHCTISFTGDNEETFCGIVFKYSSRWAETNPLLLRFLLKYLNARMEKIFDASPARFSGIDTEVEHLKMLISKIGGVIDGNVMQ